MCHHEEKYCPRCSMLFECKAGSILLCQCMAVTLTNEERDYMEQLYDDCLCAACLIELKAISNENKLNL